jgi:hypothetical protein
MRLMILSNGTPKETVVINADNGEILEGVTNITWGMSITGKSYVSITLENVPVNLTQEENISVYDKEFLRELWADD